MIVSLKTLFENLNLVKCYDKTNSTVFVFSMCYKRVILWKQGLHQRTENCLVYNFSGPD